MNARQRGVHIRRIRRTEVVWLDVCPNRLRLQYSVSLDGEQVVTIEAAAGCAADLEEQGYTVTLTGRTAEQRLAAIVELCQRVDANGGGGYVRTDAILALATSD